MSLKKTCPCDIDGVCPYDAEYFNTCEWYCSAEEPQDDPEDWWELEDDFEEYVTRTLSSCEPEPVCPFTCCECNQAYSKECYKCEFARMAYDAPGGIIKYDEALQRLHPTKSSPKMKIRIKGNILTE